MELTVYSPRSTVREFLGRSRAALGNLAVTHIPLQDIRTSLDRFTLPDYIYKAEPAEFLHLNEAMSDREAFEIIFSIAAQLEKNPIEPMCKTVRFDLNTDPLLTVLDKVMVGMWLDHERIPGELIEKADRYLRLFKVSKN